MHKLIGKIIICIVLFGISHPAKAALDNAQEFFLDNGLQVIVIPNHKAPIVKQVVLYKVGRVDEPVGKGGIAHFLEHLMFRGTHKFTDGKFNELIEKNGGISNAATSHDFTYYYQFLSVDRLELAMYLEADRMTGLNITDDVFTKEKNVVLQERNQRLSADTTKLFWEKYEKLLWDESLYGEPVSGTDEEIKNISKQDILDFYNKYYAPNNAVLILSGDIDIETAKDLAQKYYGKIKTHSKIEREDKSITNTSEYYHNVYDLTSRRKDVKISRLVGCYHLSHFDGKNPLLYAMIVLENYLSGSISSPVYQQMILQKHLAVSAATSFNYLRRGSSTFSMYAYFQRPENASKIKEAFVQNLKATLKKLTPQELEKVKKRILAGIIYQNDNPSDAAEIVVRWLGTGYSLQDIQNFEKNINAVTLEQVRDYVKTLQDMYPFWGVLMPLTEDHHEL